MKIAIDARYLSAKPSGIGRYSENLLRAFVELQTSHEWHVFVQSGYIPPPDLASAMGFYLIPWMPVSQGTLFKMGRRIDALNCDLIHIHCPIIPLWLKTPLVITCNDWQPFTEPAFSARRPKPIKLLYDQFYHWAYPRAVRKARAIINLSEATRSETIRHVPESAPANYVVLSGVAEIFRTKPSEMEISQIAMELSLPGKYVLYVGSTRPNKQLSTLIQAFSILSRGHPNCHLILVLTKDRFFAEIADLIGQLGLAQKLRIFERIDNRRLRVLYSQAATLALTSTDEGFGFPVLEALAQGTPVIIGDDGSLPEVAGDAALRVPVRNPVALAAALEKILTNRALADKLCEMGPLRADKFSWRAAARQTLTIYENAQVGCLST